MKKALASILGTMIAACITFTGLPLGNTVVMADDLDPEITQPYYVVADDTKTNNYDFYQWVDNTNYGCEVGTYLSPDYICARIEDPDATIKQIKITYDGETVIDFKYDSQNPTDNRREYLLPHYACVSAIIPSPDGKVLTIELVSAYYVYIQSVSGDIDAGLTPEGHDDYFNEFEFQDITTNPDQPCFAAGCYTTNPDPILKIGSGMNNRLMGIFFEEEVGIDNCFGNNYFNVKDYANEVGDLFVFVDVMPVTLSNIRWHNFDAAEREGDYIDSEELLEHGSAKIVAIYEEQEDGTLENVTALYNLGENGAVDSDGYGDIFIQAGHIVEFEFVPERGWQVDTLLANGAPLEPQNNYPNHYFYQMPDTNIHFKATFKEASDTVSCQDSDAVASGSIVLADGEFSGGSANLVISDTEKFGGELDTDTYKAISSMTIDLFNHFNMANTDGKSWDIEVTDLNGEAQVTIKLSEPLELEDGEVVYIAHDHNGKTEYIPVKYNAESLYLTFTVNGFSEFAIVVKKAPVKTITPAPVQTTPAPAQTTPAPAQTTPAPASIVSTGEVHSTTYMIGALFIAAAAGVVLTAVRAKKNEE